MMDHACSGWTDGADESMTPYGPRTNLLGHGHFTMTFDLLGCI